MEIKQAIPAREFHRMYDKICEAARQLGLKVMDHEDWSVTFHHPESGDMPHGTIPDGRSYVGIEYGGEDEKDQDVFYMFAWGNVHPAEREILNTAQALLENRYGVTYAIDNF